MESEKEKFEIVLHTCCAVCGALLAGFLKKNFKPIIFFYNPNIQPEKEYQKRKRAAKILAALYGLEFIEGKYDSKKWFKQVKGLEKEQENGKRCNVCFQMRLFQTGRLAKMKNISFFSSTLAISPYKNENLINEIGENIAKSLKIEFLTADDFNIKKKEFWLETKKLAKKYNFYHQQYCGCIFSKII